MLVKLIRLPFEAQTTHPVIDALALLRGIYAGGHTRCPIASRSDSGAPGATRSTPTIGIKRSSLA
jgi:hypothetical protein